jgi:hypothetical protein
VTDWRDRVQDLLYEGETVDETVDVADNRLVVTSHRLLAFTPDGDANYQHVDRPNVDGLSLETDGNPRYTRWSLRPAILGLLLLGAGTQFSIDDPLSSIDTSGAGAAGTGGIVGTVREFTRLLTLVDDVMRAAGALSLLVVVLLLALYLRSRQRRLVVQVAGDDSIEVPVSGDVDAAVSRLDAAINAVPEPTGTTAATAAASPSDPGASEPSRDAPTVDPDEAQDAGAGDGPTSIDDLLGGDDESSDPFEPGAAGDGQK